TPQSSIGVFRRFLFVFCFAAFSQASVAAPALPLSDIELSTVFIDVDDHDSNFTVVDARYDETATAAALFGLAGAALNSAANASQDDAKADTLRSAAKAIDIKGILERNLTETLGRRGELDIKTEKSAATHAIVVGIHNWGLSRMDRDDKRMRTFLNLSIRILDAKGHVVWEKTRENSVGQNPRLFEEFNSERLTSDMETLAAKAGQYIGNQINYR
ncbi:MAG: hypothetical protein ACOZAA_12735, partial [Pseudomonadota bacterium]